MVEIKCLERCSEWNLTNSYPDLFSRYYWFSVNCHRTTFYKLGNNFYLGLDRFLWIEAIKYLEMIGNDWNLL